MQAVTVVAFLAVASLVSGQDSTPAVPTVDLAGAALSSFTELTKQINQIQTVLSQLNGQMTKMVTMSTRLITPPAGPAHADSNDLPALPNLSQATGGITQSIFATVQQMTSQLSQIQSTIQQVTRQLQQVVETSTRMITGPALYQSGLPAGAGNVIDSILSSFRSWSSQLEQMNGVLRGMSKQWNRVLETGTRMITGQSGPALYADASTPSSSSSSGSSLPTSLPGLEQIQSFFSLLTGQFAQFQRILTDFQAQLTRMTRSIIPGLPGIGGARLSPQPLDAPATTSPGDSVLAVVNTLTQQFQQIQRVLAELNQQLNRMIETGSKSLG